MLNTHLMIIYVCWVFKLVFTCHFIDTIIVVLVLVVYVLSYCTGSCGNWVQWEYLRFDHHSEANSVSMMWLRGESPHSTLSRGYLEGCLAHRETALTEDSIMYCLFSEHSQWFILVYLVLWKNLKCWYRQQCF